MTREEQIYKKAEGDCIAMLESIERGDIIKGSICPQSYRAGFMDGAKWADQYPQWIPVEERLPETIDWYLCYNDLEDGCEVLHWEGDGNVWMDNDWHYKSKEVTHWMPIVPPRKED